MPFLEALAARGVSTPALENRCAPAPHLGFAWTAFWHLCADRAAGWSIGPIPWSAIDRYAVRHGLDEADAFERFRALIEAMDRVYLAHVKFMRDKGKTRGDKS